MKKLFVSFAAFFAVAVMFTACSKEGDFRPLGFDRAILTDTAARAWVYDNPVNGSVDKDSTGFAYTLNYAPVLRADGVRISTSTTFTILLEEKEVFSIMPSKAAGNHIIYGDISPRQDVSISAAMLDGKHQFFSVWVNQYGAGLRYFIVRNGQMNEVPQHTSARTDGVVVELMHMGAVVSSFNL